ncbi:MAG TPA: AI-2E family transporter, partial [Arthrobacter sp.]|nr:AI-2E family transporter [Arthrobacter sp.]
PLLAVVNTAVRYIAGRTWEHDGGLGAAEAATAEGSPGPDGDSNFKDVAFPAHQSRGATSAESKAKVSGSAPAERTETDTNKGE